ncbi:MAG: dephospho-CoA kinase [Bacteroidales bacterium]|nr:dephospho-CoA kinase [Bacteroidales bacterium]
METKTLGITGGIGSGKSYISSFFENEGVPVYDSDSRTKELYSENKRLLAGLKKILGKEIEDKETGKPNFKAIASKIFNDEELMDAVREFVYPFVMKDFQAWKERQIKEADHKQKQKAKKTDQKQENKTKDNNLKLVGFESAVILESEYVKSFMDKVLLVTAPLPVRIERVVKRDNCSREAALERISNQWSDEERRPLSDFEIVSVEGNNTLEQVKKIIEQLSEDKTI